MRPEVMFIKAIECNGREHTMIVEEKQTLEVTMNPLDLIKKSCIAYGVTYNGRRDASKLLLSTEKKVPVIIDHIDGIYLFPLASHIGRGNAWISLSKVERILPVSSKCTSVLFRNGQRFSFPVSERSLQKQYAKASKLQVVIKEQLYELNRKIQREMATSV
nr:competence protein ComK [Bacillus sp. REN10]